MKRDLIYGEGVKGMKKISTICIINTLLIALLPMTVSAKGITVIIDGVIQNYDQPPVIENNKTLVPLRGVFEALGAKVDWNQHTKNITATKDSRMIELTIGSSKAYINGTLNVLDVSAKVKNNRTFIPIRFIGEALGADVKWNDHTKTVYIQTSGSPTQQSKDNSSIDKGIDGYGEPTLTYEKFLAIKVGETTIKEVEEMYGQALAYIDLSFQTVGESNNSIRLVTDFSGKVISKMIWRLNAHDNNLYPQVTEQNYNKLVENMSYELASIALGGPGYLIWEDLNWQCYYWFGPDNYVVSLVFAKDDDGSSLNLNLNSSRGWFKTLHDD